MSINKSTGRTSGRRTTIRATSMTTIRTASMLLAVFMILGMSLMGACSKSGDTGTAAQTGTNKATAVSSGSAVKTTAKTAVNTATQGASAASKTDSSTAASAAGAETAGETEAGQNESAQEIDLSDVQVDLKEEFTGEGNTIDLGGKTVVVSHWEPTYFLIDKPGNSPVNTIMVKRIAEAEKKYNFKIEWYTPAVRGTTYYINEFITKSMAGVKFADVISTYISYQFPYLVKNNLIVPLDQYIDYEKPIMKNNSFLYYGSLWNGKHYGIVRAYKVAYKHMMYNKTLLDWEGQPDILDLVEAKRWTWDTFLDICKNVTRDKNGDGIIDQWGITCINYEWFAKYILYSNGQTAGVNMVDGGFEMSIKNGPSIRALQFVADLCNVYKVYKYDKNNSDESIPLYLNGGVAMHIANYYGPNIVYLKKGMDSRLCPLPIGPDADSYSNMYASSFDVIAANSDAPGDIAKIWADINLIWTEDMQDLPEIIELTKKSFADDWNWSPSNPSRQSATEREWKINNDMLYSLYKLDYTDAFTGFLGELTTSVLNPVVSGKMSVSQALDSAEYKLQNIIDNNLK